MVQQLRQRRLDTRFPVLRRQLQQPHVLPIRPANLLHLQGVIGPPIDHRRVQVLAIHVPRERPRLAHQPVDHVPIIDPMLRLASQPLHRLHQRARIPHLDLLRTDPRFQPFPDQPRRHRVRVLLHLDRAALTHPHLLAFRRLQPTRRQRPQLRPLLDKLLRSAGVPPSHQGTHELPVGLSTGEVPTATQQQLLFQRLLETPMALLAVAVLVPAVRIRGLGRHTVVTHERLIPAGVPLRVPVVMHGQRHAVGAMTLGHSAQLPHGILPPLTQAGEALREAQRHVFPVRVGQYKVVQQVRKGLTLDGHTQLVQVREVRRTQPARFMHLAEEHFLGRPVLRFPLPHPPLQGTLVTLPVLARAFPLQPLPQRLGLQSWLTLQQLLQARPNVKERIRPRAPVVRRPGLTGQLAPVAILACRLAIHACLYRCQAQRSSLIQVPPYFLDLCIRHLASSSHG
jgi:hypothetical protein